VPNLSKDQAHHTDITTTLHYISKCSVVSHQKKVVWCGVVVFATTVRYDLSVSCRRGYGPCTKNDEQMQ